jgi:ribosomal protein L21E
MKRVLLTVFSLTLMSGAMMAQSVLFERYIQSTGGTLNDTLDNGTVVTLELSSDDVEQENDEVDSYYDDDLDAGWEGAPEDQNLLTLGLRFVDIMVGQGVVIDSAFVVFHAHEGKSADDVAELTIVAEATDDAVTFDENNFNENNLLTDRPRTAAQVEWTVDEDWTIWQPYKTADIGSVIQEIVDRPGWAPGNAIALIFLPEDQGPSAVENAREFTSYENIADPDDVDPEGNPGDGTNHPERRPYLQIYVEGSLSTVELNPTLFRTYPNPVYNGNLQVSLQEKAPAQIAIYDNQGRMVKQRTTTGIDRSVFDLSDVPAGIYLIQVNQNGKVHQKKIVVQ